LEDTIYRIRVTNWEEFRREHGGEDDKPIIIPRPPSWGGRPSGNPIVIINEPSEDPLAAPSVRFYDVPDDHWAADAINALALRGIVNGVGDNMFAPDYNVTREQFVRMVVNVLGLTKSGTATNFADVDESEWYAPYIAVAAENGIIKGIADDEFGVGLHITRQDMATIKHRALDLELNENEMPFTDAEHIAYYAETAVAALYGANLITGYPDGTFRPRSNLTRAEAATIIYRALEHMARVNAQSDSTVTHTSHYTEELSNDNVRPRGGRANSMDMTSALLQ